MLFQFRDVEEEVLRRMEATLRACIAESNRREKCAAVLEPLSLSKPALCDPAMMAALDAAAEAMAPRRLAAHALRRRARRAVPREADAAAMLFVPSIGGISHHWSEDTKEEDLALGVEVLAEGAARYLSA
jgi:N-carbamoyl-L-amino-acid hydrolase